MQQRQTNSNFNQNNPKFKTRIDTRRLRYLRNGDLKENENGIGPVVYWMKRDQRMENNWSLLYAQDLAINNNTQLIVVFNFVKSFINALPRHYLFMIQGLQELEIVLKSKNISFFVTIGNPDKTIVDFVNRINASILITDFSPLHENVSWNTNVSRKIKIPFHECDSHNIVPPWIVTDHQMYMALHFRKKIYEVLDDFLVDFPAVKTMSLDNMKYIFEQTNWNEITNEILSSLKKEPSEYDYSKWKPGSKAAMLNIKDFFKNRLPGYSKNRNDPSLNQISHASIWMHYGHISAQKIALMSLKYKEKYPEDFESFFEELVVRRELAENFCFYNPKYNKFEGLPDWAKETLYQHKNDHRPYYYSLKQLEKFNTHDPLFNAAMKEMIYLGKMHGFMRIYAFKKILEWSETPEEAYNNSLYLHNKYSLDSRDCNCYAGVGFIFGLHDQPWAERDIYGKVRYLSYEGCKRKFNIDAYIERVNKETKINS